MLQLFDYVYYRLSHIYKTPELVDGVNFTALGIFTYLQSLTLFIPFFIGKFIVTHEFPPTWFYIPLFILFVVVNSVRLFEEGAIKKIEAKWSGESISRKKINDKIIIAYIVLITIIPIAFAITASIYVPYDG